jgi:hypothetical protein
MRSFQKAKTDNELREKIQELHDDREITKHKKKKRKGDR